MCRGTLVGPFWSQPHACAHVCMQCMCHLAAPAQAALGGVGKAGRSWDDGLGLRDIDRNQLIEGAQQAGERGRAGGACAEAPRRRGGTGAAAGRPRAGTLAFALFAWLNVTGGTHHVALLSLGGRKCGTQGQYREQELADPVHGVNLTDTAPNADERKLLARWRVGAGARRRTPAPTPPLLLAALRRELGAVVHHDAAGGAAAAAPRAVPPHIGGASAAAGCNRDRPAGRDALCNGVTPRRLLHMGCSPSACSAAARSAAAAVPPCRHVAATLIETGSGTGVGIRCGQQTHSNPSHCYIGMHNLDTHQPVEPAEDARMSVTQQVTAAAQRPMFRGGPFCPAAYSTVVHPTSSPLSVHASEGRSLACQRAEHSGAARVAGFEACQGDVAPRGGATRGRAPPTASVAGEPAAAAAATSDRPARAGPCPAPGALSAAGQPSPALAG